MENMYIKADRDYMTTILDKVADGKYLIPEFQRDFIWDKRQMIDLFDSIVKGFPIGSIILWSPQKDNFDSFDVIGGVKIKKSSLPHYYILDGRQRLTTLISVLSEKGENKDFIYVDLKDFTILGRGKNNPILLRLSDAFDSYAIVDYIERIKNLGLDESEVKEYAEKAKRLNRILISYQIGYIVVNGGGIDDAVEIFSRLNSQGTSISPDFMIQALTFNSKTHFKFGDAIKDIQEELDPYNFSSLKRDVILKCVGNYTQKAFIDARTEDIILLDNLPDVMNEVKRSVVSAVKFLYEECRVVDVKLLPYTYQLIMLALFFKENKTVGYRGDELRKWFYYTSYTNYFTNTSLARIRYDIYEFERFSSGLNEEPINYGEVQIERAWNTPVSLGAVNTCCFVLSQLSLRKISRNMSLIPYAIPKTGKKRLFNTIWCVNKSQLKLLKSLFLGNKECSDEELQPFALDNEMLNLYQKGKIDDFATKRMVKLVVIEKQFIKDVLKTKQTIPYRIDMVGLQTK